MCRLSFVCCPVLGVRHRCPVSPVECHMSCVMCHVSHAMVHVSQVMYSFFLSHEDPKVCKICADYSTWLFFFRILVTLIVFMVVMIFQLIQPVLLTPTNYFFHDQVITPLPAWGTKKNLFTWWFFVRFLVTLPISMFFMIFQMIPLFLLVPTDYCFHLQTPHFL